MTSAIAEGEVPEGPTPERHGARGLRLSPGRPVARPLLDLADDPQRDLLDRGSETSITGQPSRRWMDAAKSSSS